MQDGAIAAEGRDEVDFGVQRAGRGGWGGGVDGEREGGVNVAGDFGFEDEGQAGVGCGYVAFGTGRLLVRGADESGLAGWMYLANSISAAVTEDTPSFLTRRMLRGGDGHCSDSRSLLRVSVQVGFGRRLGCAEGDLDLYLDIADESGPPSLSHLESRV